MVELDYVVVSATRTPKVLADVPIITRVFTASDIAKVDATNISDLLQSELPGFEISYTMNQQASVNISGFGGNSVLFLVDGERLAGETLDNVDYSRLNMDNVERIEIVKGAASSLYGSAAVGGVINIISKDASEPWSVNINGHLGAYNEQRYGGTIGFKQGKWNSTTNIQFTHVDTINLENEDDSQAAYSSIYGSKTWNFKERLVFKPIDKLTITGRLGYFFRERQASTTIPDRYRDFTGVLKAIYKFSDANDLEIAYSFDQYDKSDYVISSGLDIRDYSNVQNSVRALYNHTFADNYTLTVGGDFMRDYLMTYQFENNGERSQHEADAFAQIDMTFWDNFNVIAGARYDYYSDANANHLSTKLGLMYKLNKWRFRGSYSGGFRAPTLKEMYTYFDMASVFMIYGNEELKPEVSDNLSLSAEWSKGAYSFTVNGFYNFVKNRITTVWNQSLEGLTEGNFGAMQYTNLDHVQVRGADINASVKYDCGFGARLSYTYTNEKFDADQMVSRATRPHAANLRLEYDKKLSKDYSFNVALNGRYLSKVDATEVSSSDEGIYDTLVPVTYEGYTIWKLSLSQHICRAWSVNFAIDNLFNYKPANYLSNSSYTTGRTMSVSLAVDIEKLFKK